ncbi:MAG: inverse autotransporter beta domain-containing protein [Alphaproteobacteria bacterium]|nr:inverse autotransporter beta domain-containing protein [Alphaproteobacteria bacterium]
MKKSDCSALAVFVFALCSVAVPAGAQTSHQKGYGSYGWRGESTDSGVRTQSAVPFFGAGQADWLKRFEFTWSFLFPGRTEQSILTTQPIFQSSNKANTFFFQGSANRYTLYGDYRTDASLGAGYRRLMFGNSVLLGANAFFENEFNHGNRRAGFGAEAKWYAVDFGYNEYAALTDDKSAGGNYERSLSGRDFGLAVQAPYLPWIKLGGGYFWFDKERAAKDMDGSKLSASFALHPNVNLEYKWSSYDVNNNAPRGQNSVMLTFSLARLDHPTLSTSRTISDKIFENRNFSKDTLDKVVRDDRIVTERRTPGGVVYVGPSD